MVSTPDPVTDTGSHRLPDAAIGEAAVAQASIQDSVQDVHPTEDDLAAFRQEYYDRQRRARRTDRQQWFLFALIVGAFALLAYRSQNTDAKIQQGLYDACESRVTTAQQYNIGRETLVHLAISGPNAPKDPAQIAALTQQLRDGLLLPVENCGEPPQ